MCAAFTDRACILIEAWHALAMTGAYRFGSQGKLPPVSSLSGSK